jgi:serpin B
MPDVARRELALGINGFGIDLCRALAGQGGNLFFSPLSVAAVLGMACAGAAGQTAEQMGRVLRLAAGGDRLHTALGGLIAGVSESGRQGASELSVANGLWAQRGYRFRRSFRDLLERCYGSELFEADFAGQPEETREAINRWVRAQTREKIAELISSGLLDTSTRLVLANAVYLDGKWESPFKTIATSLGAFKVKRGLSGITRTVPFMRQTASFLYAEADGVQVLAMPYAGGKLSMVVLLPAQDDGLPALQTKLAPHALEATLSALRRRDVEVSFPRFRLETTYHLRAVLAAMGMPDAFDPERADFSGMIDLSTAAREEALGLVISEVVHKAHVDVHEEGTVAAAATGEIAVLGAIEEPRPPVFQADHPFLFLVRDEGTRSFVFLGRLSDPEGAEAS